MAGRFTQGSELGLLLRLDRDRLSGWFRKPPVGALLGLLIPTIAIMAALWMVGRESPPADQSLSGAVTASILVSGVTSFLAYGVLFRADDHGFLAGLGVRPDSLFRERALRLLLVASGLALALSLPRISTSGGAALTAGPALASAFGSVAAAVVTYALAARAMLGGPSLLSAGMGFDPEVARAAPLVYAPLPSLLIGTAAGVVAATSPLNLLAALLLTVVALLFAFSAGARLFCPVAPIFVPRAAEMAFAPPPPKREEQFATGRGISALLPGPAAAVWVRDATVGNRRFGWASRVTWPVAILSLIGLARWGESPSIRTSVLLTVCIALLVQSAAVIGLGVHERRGRRWIDRSLGVVLFHRFLGRWSWAWGHSLWLLVPVGFAWSWSGGEGGLDRWLIAGLLVSALSTTASLLSSERA